MSSLYKENNFSTETNATAHTSSTQNKREVVKINIEYLIKKIRTEKRREKKINIIIFGTIFLSVALIFYFF
jgi:hypothetical protein|tara:strand:- start:417 stop:629 length:213 start_codon:yes stop_codon:yes gene_type:complete